MPAALCQQLGGVARDHSRPLATVARSDLLRAARIAGPAAGGAREGHDRLGQGGAAERSRARTTSGASISASGHLRSIAPAARSMRRDGLCTHEQAHLCDGLVMDHVIECPMHNGRFDIRNGRALRAPAADGPQDLSGQGRGRHHLHRSGLTTGAAVGLSVNGGLPMVIVGAGHVGGRAALALREFGWQGDILLIGKETHLPYERPPLSKGLLGKRDGHPVPCVPASPMNPPISSMSSIRSKRSTPPGARSLSPAAGRLPSRNCCLRPVALRGSSPYRAGSCP